MVRLIVFVLVLSSSLLMTPELSATHVVGGDLTYECLGNGHYELTLNFRRDCFFGDPEADFDDPAVLGIFDSQGNLLTVLGENGGIPMAFDQSYPVESIANEFCAVDDATLCVEETTYKGTVELPRRDGGYIIAYQRCCHNQTLLNIVDPLETGSTFFVQIDDFAYSQCNSSPIFNGWVDIYACQDEPLIFDHSAVDPDSDSLVYSLCTPLQGATFDQPMPQPPFPPESTVFPFYSEIVYANIFSEDNMFGTGTPLTIDSATGSIFAEPGMIGQFLIGVCVQEYRDGQLLGTVIREFEVNVRECGLDAVVDFDFSFIDCNEFVVEFDNLSSGFVEYGWIVTDVNGTQVAIGSEENLIVDFPVAATYEVSLTGINDSGCESTITRPVDIQFQGVDATFEITIKECNENSVDIQLTNTTPLDGGNPAFETIDWTVIIDGIEVPVENNDLVLIEGVNFSTIDVTFTGVTPVGCTSTVTQSSTLSDLLPDASFEASLVGCQGDLITVDFTDTSVFSSIEASGWDWTITTDNGTSTFMGEMITTQITDGSIVELLVSYPNGCTGFVRDTIDLQGDLLPLLSFDINANDCADGQEQTITITPIFTGDTEFEVSAFDWTYTADGETATSTEETITVDINQDEIGEVTLSVTYDNGCVITSSQSTDPADVITIVDIIATPLDCAVTDGMFGAILSPTLSGVINDVISYSWAYTIGGETLTSSEENVEINISNDAILDVTLAVTFDNGCTTTVTEMINANDILPSVDIITIESQCSDDGTVTATLGYTINGAAMATSQTWDVNGTEGMEETIVITVSQDAVVEANLTVFLDNGCDLEVTEVLDADDLLGPTPEVDVIADDCSDAENISITLVNATPSSTFATPVSVVWNYSVDGTPFSSTENEVDLMVPANADIAVLITVTYDNGCVRTAMFDSMDLGIPNVQFAGQPILTCLGNTETLVTNPNPEWTYEWTPLDGLTFGSDTDFSNPTVEVTQAITYVVTVTNDICSVVDSVLVLPLDDVDITVDGDTNICDSVFDLSIVDPIPGVEYEWSADENFETILNTGATYSDNFETTTNSVTIYIRIVGDNPDCPVGTQTVTLNTGTLDIEVVDPFTICALDTVAFFIINNNDEDILTIDWADDPRIVEVIDNMQPLIGAGSMTESFTLNFTATNQFGCSESGELNVVVEEQPELSFDYEIEECGELTVCFTPSGNPSNLYIWNFGDEGSPGNDAIGTDMCFTYSDFGTYTINLSGVGSVCSGDPVSETITITDDMGDVDLTANGIDADSLTICGDELLSLSVDNTVDADAISWCTSSGDTIAFGNNLILLPAGENQWIIQGATQVITTTEFIVKVQVNSFCSVQDAISVGVFDFGPNTDNEAFSFTFEGFNCETNLACFQANTDADGAINWTIEGNGILLTASGDAFQCFDLEGAPMGVYTVTASAIESPCPIDPFELVVDITTMGMVGVVDAVDDVVNFCVGDEVTLTATTNIEGGQISWCDENNVEVQSGDTYTFTPDGPTTISVKLDGDNSCVDTTVVSILPFDFGPGTDNEQLDFTFSQDDCTSTEVCFEANTAAGGFLVWTISGMGIEDQILADQFPCYDFAAGGTGAYTVTLSAPDAPCTVTPITQTVIVGGDSDLGILGVDDNVINFCVGESVTAVATTTVENPEISWCIDGVVVQTGPEYTFQGDDVEELTVKLGTGSNCGDTLLVSVVPYDFGPGTDIENLEFEVDQADCESLEVCFDANTDAGGNLLWIVLGQGVTETIPTDTTELCYTFPMNGSYTVQLTAPDAPCSVEPSSQVIQVFDTLADVNIDNGDFVSFCEEGMLTLTATSNVGDDNIRWCDADGNQVGIGGMLEVMYTGPTFFVAKAGTVPACSDADTVMINGFDLVDAFINLPDFGCEGDMVTASIDGLPDGDFSYEWGPVECISGDNTGATATIDGQGDKSITVQITDNATGCTAQLMDMITFSDFGELSLEILENDTIFLGQEVTVTVIVGDPTWTYDWSTGESGVGLTSITDAPEESTTYSVTITDDNGCTMTLERLLTVIQPLCDETDIFLPNAFSPNGDDNNDLFIPRSNVIEEVEFFIYDRWGEEIFRTTDMTEGWDGTFGGETLAPDVYAYCLRVTCPNDEEFVKTGNVSLIR